MRCLENLPRHPKHRLTVGREGRADPERKREVQPAGEQAYQERVHSRADQLEACAGQEPLGEAADIQAGSGRNEIGDFGVM